MWATDNLQIRRLLEGCSSNLNGNCVWCAVFSLKLILATSKGARLALSAPVVKVEAVAALFSPSFMQTKYDASVLGEALAWREK